MNNTGEAIVDTYGPILPGEHKWLGAAVADDGTIYGVPSHNRRVVKVVPGTGQVTELGTDDVLGTRKYKYLRGIRTKAGTILGIPAWADSVLEITPDTGQVRTIGKLPLGKWMWHGAAAGLDGNIYGEEGGLKKNKSPEPHHHVLLHMFTPTALMSSTKDTVIHSPHVSRVTLSHVLSHVDNTCRLVGLYYAGS